MIAAPIKSEDTIAECYTKNTLRGEVELVLVDELVVASFAGSGASADAQAAALALDEAIRTRLRWLEIDVTPDSAYSKRTT